MITKADAKDLLQALMAVQIPGSQAARIIELAKKLQEIVDKVEKE